jgi:hypothetical protein
MGQCCDPVLVIERARISTRPIPDGNIGQDDRTIAVSALLFSKYSTNK